MFFSRTDLPVPDGPMIAVMRPLGTSKLMSLRTVCEPNDFVTPRKRNDRLFGHVTPLDVCRSGYCEIAA